MKKQTIKQMTNKVSLLEQKLLETKSRMMTNIFKYNSLDSKPSTLKITLSTRTIILAKQIANIESQLQEIKK